MLLNPWPVRIGGRGGVESARDVDLSPSTASEGGSGDMSFGPWEWLIVLGVIVLLFGAKKLPELARSLGKSTGEFKKGLKEGAEDESGTSQPTPEPPDQASGSE
jgi:sec-independent protein translocase protein TatA